MTVLAFSTPRHPGEWRWRIVGYTCDDVIEESPVSFPTMADALAAGQLHVSQLDRRERVPERPGSHPIGFPRLLR